MGVAWPAALAGLFALALPLLIHLLARGEFQRIAVATTRFVRERPRLRWRRVQITHPLLLILRMALIALCVLLIAEPFRPASDMAGDAVWTLVSTRLDAEQARALIDKKDATPRWLAPGFPYLDQPKPVSHAGQLWSLLDAADKLAPPGMPFDVIVPTSIGPPGAQRPKLARVLRWVDAGSVTTNGVGSEPMTIPMNIDIVFDPGQQPEADAIATAVAAWRDAGLSAEARMIPVRSATVLAPFVVWLSSAPFPTMENASRVVVARRSLFDGVTVATGFSADGSVAVREQHVKGVDVRILDAILDADGLPEVNLARDLLNAFIGSRLSSPPKNYPVAIAQLESTTGTLAQGGKPIRQSLTSLFIWLVAWVATLERIASAMIMRASRDA